jgi:pilus assembly protein CpaE
MVPRGDLYLVTRESTIASAVSTAIGVNGDWSRQALCATMHDLLLRLQSHPRAAVLVDIDPAPEHTLSDLDQITRRFSEARFIVLSSSFNSDLMLQAMQAGARHFMVKSAIPSDLVGVVHRLAAEEAQSTLCQGAVISILSAGGGCGATTLTVNLAAELHQRSTEPVLMVDLDGDYGTLGAYLGVKGQYGIADVLSHPGRVDSQLITSTAEAYSQGLHVLLSPAGIDFARRGPIKLDELDTVLQAACQAYGYSVVDAPRVPLAAAINMARTSLLTIVVFQLTVKDIRIARELFSGLTASGIPAERVMLLANRCRSRHGLISLQEARQALGVKAITCVDNDYKGAIRGADYGKPLAEVMPRSAIRKSMRQLAEYIVNARPVTTRPTETYAL